MENDPLFKIGCWKALKNNIRRFIKDFKKRPTMLSFYMQCIESTTGDYLKRLQYVGQFDVVIDGNIPLNSLKNKLVSIRMAHIPFHAYFRYNGLWWYRLPSDDAKVNVVSEHGNKSYIPYEKFVGAYIDDISKEKIRCFAKMLY